MGENPLDLVLYIVAVFFILEIDDMLVRPRTYNEILKWFEDTANIPKMKSTPMSFFKYKLWVILNVVLTIVLIFPLIFYFLILLVISSDHADKSQLLAEVIMLIILVSVVLMNVICKILFYCDL